MCLMLHLVLAHKRAMKWAQVKEMLGNKDVSAAVYVCNFFFMGFRAVQLRVVHFCRES